MSWFFSYIEAYNKGEKDFRRYELINQIVNFFEPKAGDKFYFMDPYFDILKSLKSPYSKNTVEEDNWSFLINELSYRDTEIKIITRESVDSVFDHSDLPPYAMPFQIREAKSIEICKYSDGKYNELALHDRYILQVSADEIKGIHIGPSLSNIEDKDVSISIYDKQVAKRILTSFHIIWDNCILTKGWKKG